MIGRLAGSCLILLLPLALAAQQGRPYTALRVTEITRTDAQGVTTNETFTEKIARDGSGRVFIDTKTKGRQRVILIDDPAAKVSFTLHPDTMQGERQVNATTNPGYTAPFNPFTFAYGTRSPSPGQSAPPPNVQHVGEDLGTRRIEGLDAQGERTTYTLAAGTIVPAGTLPTLMQGVALPAAITVVTEFWRAPGYGVVERSQTSGSPLVDTVHQHWENFTPGEPDPNLFDTSGYKFDGSG